MTAYDRAVLVEVITYHHRRDIKGCGCGWAELGRSHSEHVATVYEESVAARTEPRPDAAGASAAPPLTRPQLAALAMIRRADQGEAYLAANASWTESGGGFAGRAPWTQAFIHWRTARALERKGLVRVEGRGEAATVYLAEPSPSAAGS